MNETKTIWKIPAGEFTHTEMAELNGVKNQAVWSEYKRLRDEGFIVSAGIRKGIGKPTGIWKVADGKIIITDTTLSSVKTTKMVKVKPVITTPVVVATVEQEVKPTELPTAVEMTNNTEILPVVEPAKAPELVETVEVVEVVQRPIVKCLTCEITETDFLCPFCKNKLVSMETETGVRLWCRINDFKICSCSENPYGHSNNIKNAYEILCQKYGHVKA
jgi:hypothetical protein